LIILLFLVLVTLCSRGTVAANTHARRLSISCSERSLPWLCLSKMYGFFVGRLALCPAISLRLTRVVSVVHSGATGHIAASQHCTVIIVARRRMPFHRRTAAPASKPKVGFEPTTFALRKRCS